MLRRLKSSKDNGSLKDINSGINNSSRFVAHTTINFTSSPGNNTNSFNISYIFFGRFHILSKFLIWVCSKNVAEVRGGCLYGGPLRSSSNSNVPKTTNVREKGVVQVFTYKELEMATEQFSEGNVIGNGGFGVVYKGVLSDGTVAAIKKLRRDGKQGERAFRMEVSATYIYYFCFHFALSLSFVSFLPAFRPFYS